MFSVFFFCCFKFYFMVRICMSEKQTCTCPSTIFTDHKVCSLVLPSTCLTFTWSLPFCMAKILHELPCTNLSMLITSYMPVSSLVIWYKALKLPIQVCFVNVHKDCPLIIYIIPASWVKSSRSDWEVLKLKEKTIKLIFFLCCQFFSSSSMIGQGFPFNLQAFWPFLFLYFTFVTFMPFSSTTTEVSIKWFLFIFVCFFFFIFLFSGNYKECWS